MIQHIHPDINTPGDIKYAKNYGTKKRNVNERQSWAMFYGAPVRSLDDISRLRWA